MFNQEGGSALFTTDNVIMASFLGLMSWGGMALFAHESAIAEIRVEQKAHDLTAEKVEVMHGSVIRTEEGIKHLTKSMDQQRDAIMKMYEIVQGLD